MTQMLLMAALSHNGNPQQRFTFSESVLIDKVVFFLLDDDDPHLLLREDGCPSEVGVLCKDVPSKNLNSTCISCSFE